MGFQLERIVCNLMPMNEDELLYQISITQVPGIGPRLAKQLIHHCGSASFAFKDNLRSLSKIEGISYSIASSLRSFRNFKLAEEEIRFIEKNNIETRFYTDENFPFRLKFCSDAPILLFGKGNIDWNPKRALSVVGTRRMTSYGKKQCNEIINDLSTSKVSIISGMAYGVDICAHKAALKNNLPTLAVVAHGLDRIYPSVHRNTLVKMLDRGGMITEFISGTNPDRENFPKRNRIIAGLSDATLVIESGAKGGSMITADIAASYSRDVFAVPGNNGSIFSEGCNYLIHTQKASLLRNADDLKKIMNWQNKKSNKPIQTSLFVDLNEEEKKLITFLHLKGPVVIDDICINLSLPIQKTSVLLLNLEFKGMIESLPGKVYQVL